MYIIIGIIAFFFFLILETPKNTNWIFLGQVIDDRVERRPSANFCYAK